MLRRKDTWTNQCIQTWTNQCIQTWTNQCIQTWTNQCIQTAASDHQVPKRSCWSEKINWNKFQYILPDDMKLTIITEYVNTVCGCQFCRCVYVVLFVCAWATLVVGRTGYQGAYSVTGHSPELIPLLLAHWTSMGTWLGVWRDEGGVGWWLSMW